MRHSAALRAAFGGCALHAACGPCGVAIPKSFRNAQEIATPVCELARNDMRFFGAVLVLTDNLSFLYLHTKTSRFSRTGRFFLFIAQHVLQTHLQDGPHMVICQRVVDILSLPAELGQVHLL